MNKFFGIGNLTKAPDVRETASGKKVASLSLAINHTYDDGVDFFPVTVWGNQAENCGKYLDKGSKVGISGTLQNRTYETEDGVKRTVTEIIADSVEFLTPKSIEDKDTITATKKRPLEELGDDEGELPF